MSPPFRHAPVPRSAHGRHLYSSRCRQGNLYRYFKDKEELYLALLDRASEQMEERLYRAAAQSSDPRCQLEAITATIIDYFDEQPFVFDIIQHAEALQSSDMPLPWKARAVSMEVTEKILSRGRRPVCFAQQTLDSQR